MKKFFPQLLLAAALLVSCDPSYDYEISVDNQTDHEVRIQSVDARLRNLKDSAHLPVYTIPAKSVRILEYGSPLGSPSLDDVGWRFYALFRDSLQLTFDDGRKLVCTAARDSAQGPYAFMRANSAGSSFRYVEKYSSSNEENAYGRLTYMVSDSDYAHSR